MSLPFVARLTPAQGRRLERLVRRFLDEVEIAGLRGHRPSRADRVRLAACASVLFVGRPEWPFPVVRKVLVSPVPVDDGGQPSARGGLGGYFTGGVVTLCRQDLDLSFVRPEDGYHIALHEFAHALDAAAPGLDGVPPSVPSTDAARWSTMLETTRAAVRAGTSSLSAYATRGPAETFAVAVERFFERPRELQAKDRELYDSIARVLRLDPASDA